MPKMHTVEVSDSNQRSPNWCGEILMSGDDLGRHADGIYYGGLALPSTKPHNSGLHRVGPRCLAAALQIRTSFGGYGRRGARPSRWHTNLPQLVGCLAN